MRVLAVGEVLWDVFPDRELLGGAALNFCANLHPLGDSAFLLSAVGSDRRGRLALSTMTQLGLDTRLVQTIGDIATGTAEVVINDQNEPTFSIRRPAAFDKVTLSQGVLDSVSTLDISWLYFGTLTQTEARMERVVLDVAERLPHARRFYDMNLRDGHWNIELIQRLCQGITVLKLNESEAHFLATLLSGVSSAFTLESFCRQWASHFRIEVICVTLGPRGCFIFDRGDCYEAPANKVVVRDTVGAGDAFAAAFLHGYHNGWSIPKVASFANALGALVASRDGATPEWALEECLSLAGATYPARQELPTTQNSNLVPRVTHPDPA